MELEWKTVQRKFSELVPLDVNPRKISEAGKAHLQGLLEEFNVVEIPVINTDNTLIAGLIGGVVMLQNQSVENPVGDRYGEKPFGRKAYIININRDFELKYNGVKTVVKEYADPQYYIDLSVLR